MIYGRGNVCGNILPQVNLHIQIFGLTKVKKNPKKAFVLQHQELTLHRKKKKNLISGRTKQTETTKDIPSYVPFHLLDHVDD
jgi:hypothetical protein